MKTYLVRKLCAKTWKTFKPDLKETSDVSPLLYSLLGIRTKTAISCTTLALGAFTTLTRFWCCYLATERCCAWSCVCCWPRQSGGHNVPERPWAPGSLRGPQPVCFSGWELPFAPPTPLPSLRLTKNVNTWRTHAHVLFVLYMHLFMYKQMHIVHTVKKGNIYKNEFLSFRKDNRLVIIIILNIIIIIVIIVQELCTCNISESLNRSWPNPSLTVLYSNILSQCSCYLTLAS